MTEQEFWESTPRTFFYKLEGFSELNNIKQQAEWERTRWMTAYLLQPHAKKGKRIKPRDLITFPWETVSRAKPLSEEDKKKLEKFQNEVEEVKEWKQIKS